LCIQTLEMAFFFIHNSAEKIIVKHRKKSSCIQIQVLASNAFSRICMCVCTARTEILINDVAQFHFGVLLVNRKGGPDENSRVVVTAYIYIYIYIYIYKHQAQLRLCHCIVLLAVRASFQKCEYSTCIRIYICRRARRY
jgi:hypothetical protein